MSEQRNISQCNRINRESPKYRYAAVVANRRGDEPEMKL